jgi:hypothetical protein
MANYGTYKVDDHGQKALMRHYGDKKLDRIFAAAAKAGGEAAEGVLTAAAPVGSGPLSGIYRRAGLQHGALKASVDSKRIRRRGANRNTIGVVIGPMGRGAVARHWVTGGTRPHRMGNRMHPGARANPWVDRATNSADAAAAAASDTVITRYLSRIPGGA